MIDTTKKSVNLQLYDKIKRNTKSNITRLI